MVVAHLEAPVEEHAHRQPTGAAPTHFRDSAGVARDDGRSVRRGDIHAGVYLREELRDDPVGRPPDARCEHSRRLAHQEAESGIPTFRHRNEQDATDREVGGLERDAVRGADGVGIRTEARRDPRDGLALAHDVNGGIDGRDDEGLPRPKLRRVLDLVVVGEGLRCDRVYGRD